jgi:hypothetical protein
MNFIPRCTHKATAGGLCLICLALSSFEHEPQKHVDTPVAGEGFLPNPITVVVTSAVTSQAMISTPAGLIPFTPK